MNIIFRNKLTGIKINIQDFYHYNENNNLERHDFKLYTSMMGKSLVPTPTFKCVEYSLDDILLSDEWEIWCDNFWINEKQCADLNLIISLLFQYNDLKILNIANKLLEILKYNEKRNKENGYSVN